MLLRDSAILLGLGTLGLAQRCALPSDAGNTEGESALSLSLPPCTASFFPTRTPLGSFPSSWSSGDWSSGPWNHSPTGTALGSNANTDASSGQISHGSIAGISVGAVAFAALGAFLTRFCLKRRARKATRNDSCVLPIDGGHDVFATAMPAGTKEIATMGNVPHSAYHRSLNGGMMPPRINDETPAYTSTDNLTHLRHQSAMSTNTPSDTTGVTAATLGHGSGELNSAMLTKQKEAEAGFNRLTVAEFSDDSSDAISTISSKRSVGQYLPQYKA